MENIFLKKPIQINIIGVNLENEDHFYLKSTILFLGNVPEKVLNEINKIENQKNEKTKNETKSEILEKYYGSKWRKILLFDQKHFSFKETSTTGSFEDDIFDLIDTYDIKKKEAKETIERNIEKEEKIEEKIIRTNKISFYPEDKISELKKKIYAQTNIPIYKQHIFLNTKQALPMDYNIIVDENIMIDIRKLFKTPNKVFNVPVDINLFQNHDIIQVEGFDYFRTLENIYLNFKVRKYYLINLDDFILPSYNYLKNIQSNDTYQFQLFYYGFVLKYFPMITYEVFNTMMESEGLIKNNYPDLYINKAVLEKVENAEKKILDYKYELLRDANNNFKEYPDFQKYDPKYIFEKENKESIISVSIQSAMYSNDTVYRNISSQIKINIRNLFDRFSTSPKIPLIRTRLLMNGEMITLTKILTPNITKNNEMINLYDKIRARIQLLYYNVILFVIQVKQDYLIFSIFENGQYNIKSVWEEDIQMNFYQIYDIIEKNINPIIEEINSLGRPIFESIRRLEIVRKTAGNQEFSNLHLNILWKMPMSRTAFDQILKKIREEIISEIIQPDDQKALFNSEESLYNFNIIKGITEYDLSQLEGISNYYEYLSNARVKQKWTSLFEKGRPIEMYHQISDVKISISGLKEKEFNMFYLYFITFLYRIEKEILVNEKNTKSPVKGELNILRSLKSKDPKLYNFKRFGSDIVYSRICQKEHQPIPYLPEEYAALDEKIKQKAVKYWNFTTKSPIYYLCPNKKFPYLNFLIGYHPHDYCLPCCKKIPAVEYEILKKSKKSKKKKNKDEEENEENEEKEENNGKAEAEENEDEDEEISKKNHIYNVCMNQHVYTEQDTKIEFSRYIMNYGKPIDIGRISRLPEILDRYLLYNLENREIVEIGQKTIVRDVGFGTKTYSINLLWKYTKNNRVVEEPVEKFNNILESKMWDDNESTSFNALDIINDHSISDKHYSRIINADLNFPIIVYENKNSELFILDGIHRLIKTIINSKANNIPIQDVKIRVVYATKRQLEKSIINTGGSDVQGSVIKRPGYYLYGVSQNNTYISDIGAGFSIATALNMSFTEFIQNIILFLKKTTITYFKILLRGKLELYFKDINHVISILTSLFLNNENELWEDFTGNVNRFYLWNEFFIDITKYCFLKKVLILDDITIETTGTSIKNYKIVENINIILSEKLIQVDDLIPPSELENYSLEYILLLRRHKKTKNPFNQSHLYFPIFIIIPQTFFKTLNIEKKIFSHQDEIMKLIRSMLLTSQSEIQMAQIKNDEIDIKTLLSFMSYLQENKYECSIYKVLANSKNMCYAILLLINKAIYHFPVKYEYFEYLNIDKSLITFEPFSRNIKSTSPGSPALCNFKELKNILEEFNTYIVDESERLGFFKVVENKIVGPKLNQRENRILPVFPLIKAEKICVYVNLHEKISKVLGIKCANNFYYCQEIDITKESLRKIYNTFHSDTYNLFVKEFEFTEIINNFHYLYYDPDKINKTIYNNPKITKPPLVKYLNAVYNRYLYDIFVLEFLSFLDKDRDEKIRSEIIELISKVNFKEEEKINDFKQKLSQILKNFPKDLQKVQEQINIFLSSHFDKKILFNNLESIVYDFDRIGLLKLRKLSDEIDSPESLEKLRKYIESKSQSIIKIGEPNFDENSTINNIMVPCATEESPYCSKSKLLISEKNLDNVINIFIDELRSPIKRDFILSSILIGNIQNYFQFSKSKNEEIFILFE